MKKAVGAGRLCALVGLALALGLAGACVPKAEYEMPKLQVGMNYQQVETEIGKPENIKLVHFNGNDTDYLVWEYLMVPTTPVCPSEGLARSFAAVATLGVSEIGVSHLKAMPHWIYFMDGKLVYTSRGLDCVDNDCNETKVDVDEVSK
ncbi:MAG: hypothetical protein KQJ78_23540 [Deltaproteobacteria bacterium]|nr:hypothetical protein [Deltaproteobacteria bacterium]